MGNVGIIVLLTFENKLDIVISHINLNSMHHWKFIFTKKSSAGHYFPFISLNSCTEMPTLINLNIMENSSWNYNYKKITVLRDFWEQMWNFNCHKFPSWLNLAVPSGCYFSGLFRVFLPKSISGHALVGNFTSGVKNIWRQLLKYFSFLFCDWE